MNFLLFSPRQYENFLYGHNGRGLDSGGRADFRPPDESLGSIAQDEDARERGAGVSQLPTPSRTECSSGFWRFLSRRRPPAAGDARARISWRVIYILIAAASVAGYFISYQHPPLRPPLTSPICAPPGVPALCPGLARILVQHRRARDLRRRRPFPLLRSRGGSHLADATNRSVATALSLARFGLLHGNLGLRRRGRPARIPLIRWRVTSRYTASSVFLYIAVVRPRHSASMRRQNRGR